MKNLYCKKLLLNSIVIACFWLTTVQARWASTNDQQENTHVQKATKAKKDFMIRGKATYSHQTLEKVHGLGKTKLDHVTVKKSTIVFGKCEIKNSQLNTLEAHGKTNIIDTNIQGAASIQGMTEVDKSQFNNLRTQGKLYISESTVKGKLKAQGKFRAIHTDFIGQVHVIGRFKAQDAIFQEKVYLVGKMQASQTSFTNTITAVTQKIILHDTTTQDVYIKKDNKKEIKRWGKKYNFLSFLADQQDEPQVVTLSGKTIIQGSITFENRKGIIVMLGDEVQIKGGVIGGIIKRL